MVVKDVSGVYKKADKAYNQICEKLNVLADKYGERAMKKNDSIIQIKCKNKKCHFHTNFIPWPETIPFKPCQLCGFEMELVEGAEDTSGWLMKISADKKMWCREVEKKFPAVLAYEYRSLREYCRKEEPYAVLLSIKDNFEALLKFEVLLAYAWIAENTSEEFMTNTVSLLMTPNLSLGAWLVLASAIVKNLKEANIQLPDIIPLNAIRKKYIEEKIVNWRNTYIGHGAMGMETDEVFKLDIQAKILILKDIYTNFISKFKAQRLYLKPDNEKRKELPLMGADLARGLESGGTVYFRAEDMPLEFNVDPFLVIRKHQSKGFGIYFFDNQRTRSLTHFLAYADGKRTTESVAYFERLIRQMDARNIKPERTADEKNLTPEELHELDMLFMNHAFVKPRHLVNWLEECLDKHEKGVFLLQMNRGTGKSIFTERLSSLTENPIRVADDVDVRTYHISAMQTAGINYFQSEIEELWRREFDGKGIARMTSISQIEKEGKKPAEALCNCLEQVLEYSKRNRGKSRILMVLDGLDEIPGDEIWSYIPTESMMKRGIYFLLTSRDPKTELLPEHTSYKIMSLSVTEKYCPKRKDKDNVKFLTEYIENTGLKGKISLLDTQKLLSMSDYRVLGLGMLCRLVENGMNIEELPDSNKAVSVYLQTLEKRYGEKEAIKFREPLAILCTLGSYEGVTLKTLASLIGENGITLRLIGMIRDLSPMLKTGRGKNGNLYMIANPGLANELEKQIPETEDIVKGIISLTFALIDDGNYKEAEIDETVVHIVELARDKTPEGVKILSDKAEDKLIEVANYFKYIPSYDYKKKTIDIWNQIVILNKERYGIDAPSTLKSEAKLATAMFLGGFSREALQKCRETYDKAESVLEGNSNIMIEICGGMSVALAQSGNYKEALEFHEKVSSTIDVKAGENGLFYKLTYDSLKCILLHHLGRYDEAHRINKVVKEMMRRGNITDENLLKQVQQNDIMYYNDVGKYKKAKKLRLKLNRKLLKGKGVKSNKIDLDLASIQTAIDHGDYTSALKLYKELYNTMKEESGPRHPDTIKVLVNIASAYAMKDYFEDAFSLFKQVLKIEEDLFEPNNPLVLDTKREYAFALCRDERYVEALQLYQEVYELYTGLLGKNHPETIKVKEDKEDTLQKIHSTKQRLRLLKDMAEIYEKVLGAEDSKTIEERKEYTDLLEKNEGIEDIKEFLNFN